MVLQDFPDLGRDIREPTTIRWDQEYAFVTTTAGSTNQDTGNVAFEACAGDIIRFCATSGSNNFEQPVLIRDLNYVRGDKLLQSFKLVRLEQRGISPIGESDPNAKLVRQKFWFYQCEVACEGTGIYSLVLALHSYDEEGQLRLAGLYKWKLQITVHFSSSSPEEKTQQ